MITFSHLGKKGNLGNQLFQIASTVGLASKHGHKVVFPFWKPNKYFEHELPILDNLTVFQVLKEQTFEYHEWDIQSGKNYDLVGWLQSEKYFHRMETKKIFSFKKNSCTNLYKIKKKFFLKIQY